MKSLLVSIGEGELIPKGYGIAYRSDHSLRVVVAPIPLNLFFGFWKRLQNFLIRNPSHYSSKVCRRCFEAGFNRGRYTRDLSEIRAFLDFYGEKEG